MTSVAPSDWLVELSHMQSHVGLYNLQIVRIIYQLSGQKNRDNSQNDILKKVYHWVKKS
jgi:hypothetical protein